MLLSSTLAITHRWLLYFLFFKMIIFFYTFCIFLVSLALLFLSPVGWGYRIHRLHLCRGVTPVSQRVSWYDIRSFDGKAPVLEIWGMWSTPSLPSSPGLLWTRMIAPDIVLSMDQKIELFDYLNWVQTNGWYFIELVVIHNNTWNQLTLLLNWIVRKRRVSSFNCV